MGRLDLERELQRDLSIHKASPAGYKEAKATEKRPKIKINKNKLGLEWILAHLGKDDEVAKACEGGEE